MRPGQSPETEETLWLSDEDLALAQAVADADGVTLTETFRQALNNDLHRRFDVKDRPAIVLPLAKGPKK